MGANDSKSNVEKDKEESKKNTNNEWKSKSSVTMVTDEAGAKSEASRSQAEQRVNSNWFKKQESKRNRDLSKLLKSLSEPTKTEPSVKEKVEERSNMRRQRDYSLKMQLSQRAKPSSGEEAKCEKPHENNENRNTVLSKWDYWEAKVTCEKLRMQRQASKFVNFVHILVKSATSLISKLTNRFDERRNRNAACTYQKMPEQPIVVSKKPREASFRSKHQSVQKAGKEEETQNTLRDTRKEKKEKTKISDLQSARTVSSTVIDARTARSSSKIDKRSKKDHSCRAASATADDHTLSSISCTSNTSRSQNTRENLSSTGGARERIKALFSRPMRETSVQKVVEKIKKRNELRKEGIPKTKEPETPLRSADEKFPSKRQIDRCSPETRKKQKTANIYPPKKEASLVSRVKNDDDGQLLDDDDIPFWSITNTIDDDESVDEATDEDLPMDSELLLEVQSGLRKLVKMPETKIIMDPYASLDYLQSRDATFFTTQVIFSNTVRSMVNLNDEVSSKEVISKRRRKLTKIPIKNPQYIVEYKRNSPSENKRIPFQ
ncbi:unnamed protein product [Thelazia callipaeda]|uniref:ULP_PROTEASE domain-containing protein n=1 Tax=Thelazia callipaeda TaxID=103827 RepID=A0A0N5D5P0_THECL|nr:unnamed protein product [Thelazia callipaeda]